MEPGDLILLNPQEMHRACNLDHSEYERITINFKQSYFSRLSTPATNLSACFDFRPKGKGNVLHLDSVQLRQLLNLTIELEKHLTSDAYGADIKADLIAANILIFTNEIYQSTTFTPTNIMPDIVRKTMDYIEEHLSEEISLEQLEAAFYLNSTYISRQFKKHTGLTLRSYILRRRIALAEQYLREGLSVTEVCYQSEFNNYANFIRSFTKITGNSPGKYAKQVNIT